MIQCIRQLFSELRPDEASDAVDLHAATLQGQLSLPARKTTGANAQVAFDLGGTLIACVQQPECLTFEFLNSDV